MPPESHFQISLHDSPHTVASVKDIRTMVFAEFAGELGDFVGRLAGIVFHDLEKGGDALMLADVAAGDEAAFFVLILVHGGQVQELAAEPDDGVVFLEELREVDAAAAFVTLLIEVNGADAILDVFEVGGDVDDVVVAAHVAEEAEEAAFAEFDELFGDADSVHIGAIQVVANEDVAGDAGDVLLHQGVALGEVVDAVGGEEVLQFQAIDAGGVGGLDVKVVVVVVILVDDADAEGAGVAKLAIVHTLNKKVGHGMEVAGAEEGVDAGEARIQFVLHLPGIQDAGPVGGIAVFVVQGVAFGEAEEVLVRGGQGVMAAKLIEVGFQLVGDGEELFAFGDLDVGGHG